jgi:hypothetical protein
MQYVASSSPVFNRQAFEQLTLHNEALQRQLVSAFLREVNAMRCDLTAAAVDGARSFGDAVHRVRNASHFVAGERLTRLVANLADHARLDDPHDREAAARQILSELSLLEIALAP